MPGNYFRKTVFSIYCSLRGKCPYLEFFWSAFSRSRTECGGIRSPNAGKYGPKKKLRIRAKSSIINTWQDPKCTSEYFLNKGIYYRKKPEMIGLQQTITQPIFACSKSTIEAAEKHFFYFYWFNTLFTVD